MKISCFFCFVFNVFEANFYMYALACGTFSNILHLYCYLLFIFCLKQNPLNVDLMINLPQDGIRLIFDPVFQRLKVCTIIFVYF